MTSPDAEEKPPGGLAVFLRVTGYVLAVDVGLVAVNAWLMPFGGGGSMFLGWLLCLILIFVSAAVIGKGLGEGSLFFPVLIFAIFDFVYGVMGGRLPKLLGIRETPLISVQEADQPPHSKADVFHFSDGRVRLSLENSLTRRIRTGRIVYYVAPVVAEGWKETDPITLWVAAEGPRESLQTDWRKDLRGGYRAAGDSVFDELIREQVARRHLVSRVDAPILVWSEDPRRELESKIRIELWSLLAADLLALGSVLLPPLFRRSGKRGAA